MKDVLIYTMYNKMKKKYHRTVPTFYRKMVKTETKSKPPSTHIQDCLLPDLVLVLQVVSEFPGSFI